MTTAEKLRSIRESLPEKLGVRDVARLMGKPDTPNAYGYYEGKSFTKDRLPLDKAREIAAIFAEHGGNPADVLALAGIMSDEVEAEVRAVEAHRPQTITINLPVVLPSSAELTTMMEGVLDSVGLSHLSDEYAGRLARLLPSALAEAAAPGGSPRKGRLTQADAPLPDPATPDRDTRQ